MTSLLKQAETFMKGLPREMPEDFSPRFAETEYGLEWRDTINVKGHGPQAVALGAKWGSEEENERRRYMLRFSAWQLKEIARLGRFNLLQEIIGP